MDFRCVCHHQRTVDLQGDFPTRVGQERKKSKKITDRHSPELFCSQWHLFLVLWPEKKRLSGRVCFFASTAWFCNTGFQGTLGGKSGDLKKFQDVGHLSWSCLKFLFLSPLAHCCLLFSRRLVAICFRFRDVNCYQ